MTNVVANRCADCPKSACRPLLAPSGFMCVRLFGEQFAKQYFGSIMANESLPRTIHGLIGSVPERSPIRAPEPLKPPVLDPVEGFHHLLQSEGLVAWQKRYVQEIREGGSRRKIEPISWPVQTRLDGLCARLPHVAKAWTAFTAGNDIQITDVVIKRWMRSIELVDSAVEEAGRAKVAKLRSIYGMMYNAAKELLAVFPEALTKDDVASLRDVVDELDAMVHDAEQMMTAPGYIEEDEQ